MENQKIDANANKVKYSFSSRMMYKPSNVFSLS